MRRIIPVKRKKDSLQLAEKVVEWGKRLEESIMEKYVCTLCGYVYDEAVGDPENGIAAGTLWEDLPEDFTCPLCGVGKDQFEQE